MAKKIKDSVVVITGASSGIGRATARLLARKKACVVLAARRRAALESLAFECENLGGQALVVPTDVTDEDAVRDLARQAIARFGRIDAWVNNAAVAMFGRLEEAPSEAIRKVLETNLFGTIYGARAALPYFREQGRGNLINVSSVVARGGVPFVSTYAVSKYAINGLGMSLRQELKDVDVDVCTIMPASIDTPLFQHAANFTGRAIKPMDPVYPAEDVAEAIVGAIKRPQNLVYVGTAGRMAKTLYKVSPTAYDTVMARQVERDHFQDRPAPPSDGNLFEPMPQWTSVSGGWRQTGNGRARQVARAGLLMALPALAWLWWTSNNGRKKSMMGRLLPG